MGIKIMITLMMAMLLMVIAMMETVQEQRHAKSGADAGAVVNVDAGDTDDSGTCAAGSENLIILVLASKFLGKLCEFKERPS